VKLRIHRSSTLRASETAFTLIEVMIAITIFFMAMFSLLGVLAAGLHAASILRSSGPSPGILAAQLSLTNKLVEGTDSGTFGEIYDGYHWMSETTEAATNGLYQVEFAVIRPDGKLDSTLTVLFYRPDSQNNHLGFH
jgi:Tfp pilus assembly protein PilV